jgi:hypothetical protein
MARQIHGVMQDTQNFDAFGPFGAGDPKQNEVTSLAPLSCNMNGMDALCNLIPGLRPNTGATLPSPPGRGVGG